MKKCCSYILFVAMCITQSNAGFTTENDLGYASRVVRKAASPYRLSDRIEGIDVDFEDNLTKLMTQLYPGTTAGTTPFDDIRRRLDTRIANGGEKFYEDMRNTLNFLNKFLMDRGQFMGLYQYNYDSNTFSGINLLLKIVL